MWAFLRAPPAAASATNSVWHALVKRSHRLALNGCGTVTKEMLWPRNDFVATLTTAQHLDMSASGVFRCRFRVVSAMMDVGPGL
jgi:hypothetical protein